MLRYSNHSALTICSLLFASLAAGPARAERAAQLMEGRDLARLAADLPVGGRMRLGTIAADVGGPASLLLERFEVFASDARIIVHGDDGDAVLPAPANVYFRGTVEGEPSSRVFLAVLADGTTEGVVTRADDTYLIGGDDAQAEAGGPLEMRRVDPVLLKAKRGEGEGFDCANAQLPHRRASLGSLIASAGAAQAPATAAVAVQHTARVAIETDYEYYAKFNNTAAATSYAGNLIGYASLAYAAETGTSLVVQSVSLWTTSSDPWSQANTLCGLMEFGRYWNRFRTGVSRTIAHFLSGRNLGGGIAWIGVLCSGAFGAGANCPGLPTDAAWGGGYGFTASISGTFNINNPTIMWDIMAVAHEIGHNFNSPHTHCYNNVGGSASPVDNCRSNECKQTDQFGNCVSSCYVGSQSVPGIGTAGGGSAGNGNGTLMSYCHLLNGNYSNLTYTFGTGHPYGVQPGRVASRMSAHVAAMASGDPTCLAPVGSLFADGFESGALPGAWSSVIP